MRARRLDAIAARLQHLAEDPPLADASSDHPFARQGEWDEHGSWRDTVPLPAHALDEKLDWRPLES
jgi:hypothetical protein